MYVYMYALFETPWVSLGRACAVMSGLSGEVQYCDRFFVMCWTILDLEGHIVLYGMCAECTVNVVYDGQNGGLYVRYVLCLWWQ